MKTKKAFHLALNILAHAKLRSWLTIIGIIIGIASVLVIISISTGAQQNLENQLSGLGADIVTITPGYSKASGFPMDHGGPAKGINEDSDEEQKNLTKKDILAIKTISNVKYVMGTVSAQGEMKYNTKSATVSITGVQTEVWKDITTDEIEEGRFLIQGDSYSVLIGDKIANEIFEGISINSKIQIEGTTFNIVGIISDSRMVYMPITQARVIFEDIGETEFNQISVKLENVEDDELFNVTINLIESKLSLARGVLSEKDKDFTVTSMKTMQEKMSETMDSMSLFLGAIAAISLLVGAIGIANTLFTSVLEKTKEIGIMKAIGAKNKDILSIFLINSGLIGLVGGIGGIIFGICASSVVSSLISGSGNMASRMFGSSYIEFNFVLFLLIFSILIGMIAGLIPAYRASKLKPVDALRYE